MRDARRPPVPPIAHLRQHRHQNIPEQLKRTQDRRKPADLLVDGRGIEFLQGGGERGGIERCPLRGNDRQRRVRAGGSGETAQFRIGEPGEAPDAVSVFDRAAQQPQARNVVVGVHPAAVVADGRHRAITALPRAQRIDANPGQLGDRADRVVRERLGCLAHRAATLTTAAQAADATMPTSTRTRTNGHWRSVE